MEANIPDAFPFPLNAKEVLMYMIPLIYLKKNLSAAKLAPMCSATKLTSNGTAYLTSNSYPHGTVLGTECKCSVTVSSLNSTTSTPSTVSITMVTIHIELNTGQQLVVTSPAGGMLKNITKHNNAFNISSEQFSFSTLNVLWKNEASNSNGSFWIGFHSKQNNVTLTYLRIQ